jgi:hypothetical protein
MLTQKRSQTGAAKEGDDKMITQVIQCSSLRLYLSEVPGKFDHVVDSRLHCTYERCCAHTSLWNICAVLHIS